MKTVSVTELKRRFSAILKAVQKGESFVIVYGRERRPVAKLVPMSDPTPKKRGR